MSDYLAAQKTISYGFDSNYEVVTKDGYKISLDEFGYDRIEPARQGSCHPHRRVCQCRGDVRRQDPDAAGQERQSLHAGRCARNDRQSRRRVEGEASTGPSPAPICFLSNVYEFLAVRGVIEAKDLGSGVIGGVECDHLAFRTKDVDWQIWIAQGARPYPCRYVITSRNVDQAPQFSIQIRDWKSAPRSLRRQLQLYQREQRQADRPEGTR